MEKLRKLINNPIFFAVVLNMTALLVSVTLFVPFFEENDDAFIAMIAEGAYGSREIHLIYANVILGWIYRILYSVCPFVRWHSVLQYIFLFAAYTALTYVLQYAGAETKGEAADYRKGRMIATLMVLCTFYESYVSVQYSKTATVVCVTGYIMLMYGQILRFEKRLPVRSAELNLTMGTGYALLLYGLLLRDSSFLLATLLMIPVGLFEFVHIILCNYRNRPAGPDTAVADNGGITETAGAGVSMSRVVMTYICTFLVACIWYIALTGIDRNVYARNDEWSSFMSYNDTRMELLDYRYDLMDYNKYGGRLGEMGISSNDALLYLTWQFGDDTVLDTGKMQTVLKDAPGRWTGPDCVKALAQHIYEDVLVLNPLFMGTLFIAVFAVTGLRKPGKRWACMGVIAQMLVFAGVLVYYEYCGRWSHRIVYAAMLAIPVTSAYLFICHPGNGDVNDEVRGRRISGHIFAVVILLTACLTVFLGNRFDYNNHRRTQPEYREFFAQMRQNKDVLYIADTFTFQYAYRYDVFRPYEEGSLSNFAAVGSWFVNSPVTKDITRKYGYDNPFRAIAGVGNEGAGKVYLVDNMYLKEKMTYLKEHYREYEPVEEQESHGLKIYSIR